MNKPLASAIAQLVADGDYPQYVVVETLLNLALTYQRSYTKALTKRAKLTEIVAGMALHQVTDKAAKRATARKAKRRTKR